MVVILAYGRYNRVAGWITQLMMAEMTQKKVKILKGPCCKGTDHGDSVCVPKLLKKSCDRIKQFLRKTDIIICVDQDTLKIFSSVEYNTPKRLLLYSDVFGRSPDPAVQMFKRSAFANLLKATRDEIWAEDCWARISKLMKTEAAQKRPPVIVATRGVKRISVDDGPPLEKAGPSTQKMDNGVSNEGDLEESKEKLQKSYLDLMNFIPISPSEAEQTLREYGLQGIDSEMEGIDSEMKTRGDPSAPTFTSLDDMAHWTFADSQDQLLVPPANSFWDENFEDNAIFTQLLGIPPPI